jgi:hypothetical protein
LRFRRAAEAAGSVPEARCIRISALRACTWSDPASARRDSAVARQKSAPFHSLRPTPFRRRPRHGSRASRPRPSPPATPASTAKRARGPGSCGTVVLAKAISGPHRIPSRQRRRRALGALSRQANCRGCRSSRARRRGSRRPRRQLPRLEPGDTAPARRVDQHARHTGCPGAERETAPRRRTGGENCGERDH